jgi:hypothetical protein
VLVPLLVVSRLIAATTRTTDSGVLWLVLSFSHGPRETRAGCGGATYFWSFCNARFPDFRSPIARNKTTTIIASSASPSLPWRPPRLVQFAAGSHAGPGRMGRSPNGFYLSRVTVSVVPCAVRDDRPASAAQAQKRRGDRFGVSGKSSARYGGRGSGGRRKALAQPSVPTCAASRGPAIAHQIALCLGRDASLSRAGLVECDRGWRTWLWSQVSQIPWAPRLFAARAASSLSRGFVDLGRAQPRPPPSLAPFGPE